MIIDLKSIDEEGHDFQFTESSEELEGAFSDLIGSAGFMIKGVITLLGNTYQVSGEIKTEYPEKCSRCGYDIEVGLSSKINEIVVIEKARPRNTQVSQSQQSFDSSGPQVTYINSSSFDLKEFLHELIAASFQKYPECADKVQCDEQRFEFAQEEMPQTVGHPGFAALKNLKTKH